MTGKANEWMQIGVRVSNCRQNRNMTQEEMARRLGVTPQAVSKWERGMSIPDVSMLLDLARLLRVSTDWLLGAEWLEEQSETQESMLSLSMFPEMGEPLRRALEPLELILGEEVAQVFIQDNSFSNKTMEIRKSLSWEGIWMPLLRIKDHSLVKKKEFMIIAFKNVLYSEVLETVEEGSLEYIMKMLKETVSRKYHEILYPDLLKEIVDNLRIEYPALIEGVVPERISYSLLTEVTRIVLSQGGGMCYFPKFIEIMDLCLRQEPELKAQELAARIREKMERSDNFYVMLHERES